MWEVPRSVETRERPDVHGRDCSYNPAACPPSMEVRCTNAAGAGDRQGRRKLEQRTTPWMEEVEPRREQRSRSSCRDAQKQPNNPFAFPPSMEARRRTTARMQEVRLQGKEEVELRQEQQPRATQATGRDAGSYDSREGGGKPRREQRSRATQES